MALYIPHSIFHLARLLYVRPETFGPYYVPTQRQSFEIWNFSRTASLLRVSNLTLEFDHVLPCAYLANALQPSRLPELKNKMQN